jgi:ligand-binding SRPBCC domain-containing protein
VVSDGLLITGQKIVSFEFMSAQKSATPDEIVKRNNINMLAHRFSIAPMMDWTDRAETTKQHQHLSMVEVSHAVPNAVPSR